MASDQRTGNRARYHFPPLERRGVIAGWRGGQIASVAAGLMVGVLAIRSRPSVEGVILAVAGVVGGIALAFWPIQGRTGEQWLPLVVRWVWSSGTGSRRQLATAPDDGWIVTVGLLGVGPERSDPVHALHVRGARSRAAGFPDAGSMGFPDSAGAGGAGRAPFVDIRPTRRPSLVLGRRSVFDGVDILGAPFSGDRSPELGVVFDRPGRTATVVLAVRGHSFALLGPEDQDSRIAAWARTLSSMAREGSEVHRVQWLESCLPDGGSAVRRYWEEHGVLGPESSAARSYGALVDESSPVTRRHRVLIGLSIHTAHSSRSIRASGGGFAGVATVLSREILSLQRALDSADIYVDGVLGPGALSRVVKDAITPMSFLCSRDSAHGSRSNRSRIDENYSNGKPTAGSRDEFTIDRSGFAKDGDGSVTAGNRSVVDDRAEFANDREHVAFGDGDSTEGANGKGRRAQPSDHVGADHATGHATKRAPMNGTRPRSRAPRGSGRRSNRDDETPFRWPWPMVIEPLWHAVHTDATWHATYWIAEWPRIDVTADFLGPLFFSPVRRSISMVMEPVSPIRAARQVAQARTADLADGELRRRGGFLTTARHVREKRSVEERDAELAQGHAQYRFSGYLTVTGDTESELETACAAIEQAAGQAGLEIHLLYGAQDAAFACSLPLGRGLS